MELFALSHNKQRPLRCFQEVADGPLQALLGSTLAQFDLLSIQKALLNLLDIMEHSLEQFTGGQVQLTQTHMTIIKQLRERQHHMNLDEV